MPNGPLFDDEFFDKLILMLEDRDPDGGTIRDKALRARHPGAEITAGPEGDTAVSTPGERRETAFRERLRQRALAHAEARRHREANLSMPEVQVGSDMGTLPEVSARSQRTPDLGTLPEADARALTAGGLSTHPGLGSGVPAPRDTPRIGSSVVSGVARGIPSEQPQQDVPYMDPALIEALLGRGR